MRQSARWGASLACALLLTACGGSSREEARNDSNASAENPLLNSQNRPEPITATGCLTSANGRYVVTSLDSTAAVPTTVTYQLSGAADSDLEKNVNREVRLSGEADPPQVADVRQAPTPAVGTSGETGKPGGQPQDPGPRVRTQESMRFAVRDVKVLSVTPTGDACPSQEGQQAR